MSTTLTRIWSHQDPSITPSAAADLFAATFDPPRKVINFDGHWYAREYEGHFQLRNGVAQYTLTCDPSGTYSVLR